MGSFAKRHWLSFASFAGMVVSMALPYAHLDVPIFVGRCIAELFAFIFLISISIPLYHVIKPKIKRIRQMWPIFFMGLGVLFFGIGAIWYLIQLPGTIAISPPSQSASTPTPGPQGPQGPPGPQGPAGPPGPKSEIINQPDMEIIKKLAYLDLLRRDLSNLKELKGKYENDGPKMHNLSFLSG